MNPKTTILLFSLAVLTLTGGCTRKKTSLAWEKDLFRIGSESSPRATDLNGDGILDIVMGAGENEYQPSKLGVLALDGASGEIIWQQASKDQVFGSASFYDITGDGLKDIFIGGRSNQLKALDGKTGSLLWEYVYHYEDDPVLKYARFNFYNSIVIPDQNGDGLDDLFTVTGGNLKAKPYDESDRYPGVLMVIDIKTGQILAADTMPDGKESYMSPLCFAQPGRDELTIIFGSGGETISGNLYMAKLPDLMSKNLSRARIIASENGHGFIAPPAAADINGDGLYDIIAISHASTVFAVNGLDSTLIWKNKIDNTESSNSFSVGYFTDDRIPDFFTFVSKGQWPQSTGSVQVMIDGSNGNIAYMDSMGCTGFSSPVVYDLNHDGREEAIISINEYDCNRGFTDTSPLNIENKLIAIDFAARSFFTIDQLKNFKNIFSTPWIGDLDHDKYLDIVYCQYYSSSPDLLIFLGMKVKCVSTHVRAEIPPAWGAYMGSGGNGIFPVNGE
ncbi:MAG TPA: hypothetical protein VI583_11600 [Cyclobacteriaceae bacterium]|nr:hypothetical protein [Cyclobacteriaceae bacterium]